nr:LOW QUALITY PROTEIN: ras-like protein [Lepeophtheirus salmonis]
MGKKSKKGASDEDGLIYIKVGIFGGGGVGKSCLTLRFQNRKFVETYDPTILDSFLNKTFMVDGVVRPLEIMDTAGQDEYKTMMDLYLKTSDGFFMVYDVTDRASFNEISTLVKSLKLARGIEDAKDLPPTIIIGNKCDLNERRNISFEEGQSLAEQFGPNFASRKLQLKRISTLSKSVFEDIVRMILSHNRKLKKKKRKENRNCSLL